MVIRTRRRNAVALLDTIAALAVLSGGVFMAMTFFRTEVRELRGTQDRLAALLLAQSEVERLYAGTYEAIRVGTNQPLDLSLPAARRVRGALGYLTVVETEPGLKRATVRIAWRSRLDRLRRFTVLAHQGDEFVALVCGQIVECLHHGELELARGQFVPQLGQVLDRLFRGDVLVRAAGGIALEEVAPATAMLGVGLALPARLAPGFPIGIVLRARI